MYTAGQASALKNERARSLPPARACLSKSQVTKQREPVHAHQKKRYSSRIFDFHLFSNKQKDIFKSPYDVLSRNKNRLNDSS